MVTFKKNFRTEHAWMHHRTWLGTKIYLTHSLISELTTNQPIAFKLGVLSPLGRAPKKGLHQSSVAKDLLWLSGLCGHTLNRGADTQYFF